MPSSNGSNEQSRAIGETGAAKFIHYTLRRGAELVSLSPFAFRFLATARVQNGFGQMDSIAHPRGELVGTTWV
ncbi:hypothetical protein D3C85_1724520 [compost metagenome]